MSLAKKTLWAKTALLANGWADNVRITINQQGDIDNIKTDTCSRDCEKINATVIPGITNLHSHAHQRAMAGLAERAHLTNSNGGDNFWSWRKVMYHYLERIQPDDLYAIACQLYLEMLKFGYTGVGEFQYLHHNINGSPYANRAEMTHQCINAAVDIGIAFTALPVLYCYGGFGGQPPTQGQKRFINDAISYLKIVESIKKSISANPNCSIGIAPHSLRAVTEDLMIEVLDESKDIAAIHIHVAEQIREVDDCLAWSRQRPVEWLLNRFDINENWCLIHATHLSKKEILNLIKNHTVAGLCPTTEANLGDGIFNAEEYFKSGGNWGIGSDSHISVSPAEELRWLEYVQRLYTNQRNVLSSSTNPNTATYLFKGALAGGAQATGRLTGKIEPGFRADLIVLDDNHPRLYGRSTDNLLSSWIFSGNENPILDVYVGGIKVIDEYHHALEDKIASNFKTTLDRLAV